MAENNIGGIADKLGNRYEAKWLVRQLLDVISGQAQWLQFEGISASFKGFEAAVRREPFTEWHQAKIKAPHRNGQPPSLSANRCCLPFREGCALAQPTTASSFPRTRRMTSDQLRRGQREPTTPTNSSAPWLKRSASLTTSSRASGRSMTPRCTSGSHAARFALFPPPRSISVSRQSGAGCSTGISSLAPFGTISRSGSTGCCQPSWSTRSCSSMTAQEFKHWQLDPTLIERINAETDGYLADLVTLGSGRELARRETTELGGLVGRENSPRIVLLTGVAGAGKSGVVRGLIALLRSQDIQHLALRIDHHLDVRSPQHLWPGLSSAVCSPAAIATRSAHFSRHAATLVPPYSIAPDSKVATAVGQAALPPGAEGAASEPKHPVSC